MNETDDEAPDPLLQATRFWIQNILTPIFVCIGITGNVITVNILTRKRMRCTTNMYLSALAVTNIIYLFVILLLSFENYPHIHDGKYELYWRLYGITKWFCDAASNTSVWLIVVFSIERYVAVRYPMKGKYWCTENRAKSAIVILGVVCFLVTLPTTFEYQLRFDSYCIRNCTPEELANMTQPHIDAIQYLPEHDKVLVTSKSLNPNTIPKSTLSLVSDTSVNPSVIYVPFYPVNYTKDVKFDSNLIATLRFNSKPSFLKSKSSDLTDSSAKLSRGKTATVGSDTKQDNNTQVCCKHYNKIFTEDTIMKKSNNYQQGMYWFTSVCFVFLPEIIIACANCLLISTVYESQRRRESMTTSNSENGNNMSNENRITIILIGMVFLFLTCETPTAFHLIYYYYKPPKTEDQLTTLKMTGNIFNMLMVINASCSFVLYCVFSQKYRETFKQMFCRRKTSSVTLSATKSQHSQKFNPDSAAFRRNATYRTPRNLETQSLTGVPRSKSLMARPPGKAKSTDYLL